MPKNKPPRRKRPKTRSLFTKLLGGPRSGDALERAQEVAYDAWEAATPSLRKKLARKALTISPLCADAYVLLAEHEAVGSAAREELFRHGVEAGEKALGAGAFTQDAGQFWGILETRPYMRARLGLAEALWKREAYDEALDHFRELLRLNPNDNQGVRYVLAAYLMELARHDELGRLLNEYDEECSAAWAYTKTLLSFRTGGDGPASQAALLDALAENPHVPDYLLGRKRLPKTPPPLYEPGANSEAVYYVQEFGTGWEKSASALEWIASRLPAATK